MQKFSDIDHYIAGFPDDAKVALAAVRQAIREAAPDASETISYQMPTFVLEGRYLLHFAAYKKHLSIFGLAAGALAEHEDALRPYVTEKGALQFPYGESLPIETIRTVVQSAAARIESNRRRRAS